MGFKEVALIVGVGGAIFFPIIYSPKGVVVEGAVPQEHIILKEGRFGLYNGKLEKRGSFERLILHQDGSYWGYNFWIEEVKKGYRGVGVRGILKGDDFNITGFTVYSPDYNLTSNWGHYSLKGKWLEGGKFIVTGKAFIGKGKSFKVWEDHRVVATAVDYKFFFEK